jgi:hypothetical protein
MSSLTTTPQDRFRNLAMEMAMNGGTEEEILTAIATRGGNEDDHREMVQRIILQTQTARDLRFHHRDVFPFARILGIIAIAAGVLAFLIGVRFFGTIAAICGVLLIAGVDPREKM